MDEQREKEQQVVSKLDVLVGDTSKVDELASSKAKQLASQLAILTAEKASKTDHHQQQQRTSEEKLETNNNNLPLDEPEKQLNLASTSPTSTPVTTPTSVNCAQNQPPRQQPQQQQQQQHHNQQRQLASASTSQLQLEDKLANCKERQLSYLQILLLRNWPCLAILICVMCSLLFGMFLSVLTVYLMHGMTDCSNLALAAAGSSSHIVDNMPLHDSLRRPTDFEAPLELASLASNGLELGRGHYSAALSLGPGQQAAQADSSAARNFRRLPSSLWPLHYDLFIQPYIAEPFNFSGKVSIRIKCAEQTDNITLHTLDLSLDEKSISLKLAPTTSEKELPSSTIGRLQAPSSQAPKVKGLSQDKELQYSIVQLDKPLEVGQEYVLSMDFAGSLNDDLAGFYKIKYEPQNAKNGQVTWVAATQFQATDARRAFPCFDEPLYKATFSIQIKHWKNMTALSNMPIIDRQDSPDGLWVTDTFGKSRRMSTYLVAYAVTNFESRSEGNISVWTRPGMAHTAEYALKIAGKILRHYEDFFGVEYPLPKMDMIALPDFNAGAMENWGLITYRETAMLYDQNSSSVANKQRVATVVAHELAHQWFGNLVTPKWWDDLWLNEGFASYVEYIGVDFVEPTWRMLEQFVIEEIQPVFKLDSLSSSHQISIPVNNPDEISEIFDHISYSKGSSIIRMMSSFLTDGVFKHGLRRYLKALKYSNAEQKDLWAHLTEVQSNTSAVDVEKVMNSWTLQTGYPLVTLTRKYGAYQQATLEQSRHQAKPSASKLTPNQQSNETQNALQQKQQQNSKLGQRWEIPITFTSKSEQNWKPVTRLWLHQNDSNAIQLNNSTLPLKSDDDWILLNVNQVGYYRVNYDMRNWKLLIDQLMNDHTKISTINRAQIIDDIFDLAKGGFLDYRFVLNASKYIKKELEFLPYDSMFASVAYIDEMLRKTPIYGNWRDYMSQLMSPFYNRYKELDWTIRRDDISNSSSSSIKNSSLPDPNNILEQYNQVNAIAWACQVDEHCKQKARSLFNEFKSTGKNTINPALRSTVYCTNIENGSKEDWNFLWKVYNKEQNAIEKDRILRALACTKEHWLLARYLDWTFDKNKSIRRQDGTFVFKMIGKNEYGREIAFDFMRERWSIIKEHYGKSSFSMGNLVRSISNSMNTPLELSELKAFYEQIKHDAGTGKRAFQIAIDEVENNIAWRERSYKVVEEWLRDELGPSADS